MAMAMQAGRRPFVNALRSLPPDLSRDPFSEIHCSLPMAPFLGSAVLYTLRLWKRNTNAVQVSPQDSNLPSGNLSSMILRNVGLVVGSLYSVL